jgi:prepilin-type N-terminal cleavage/methylation domain-containing protein
VTTNRQSDSRGFTLVEILIVIVIIGILAVVVVFAVRGMADRGQTTACTSDARTINRAVEAYFAQNSVQVLPASGAGVERYERTVVNAGLLTQVSKFHDVNSDGTVTSTGVPCT